MDYILEVQLKKSSLVFQCVCRTSIFDFFNFVESLEVIFFISNVTDICDVPANL